MHRQAARRPDLGDDFSKSSTRTRGFRLKWRSGNWAASRCSILNGNDIQLGRSESIKDTARVLGRMVHGAVIRTTQSDVEDFARTCVADHQRADG